MCVWNPFQIDHQKKGSRSWFWWQPPALTTPKRTPTLYENYLLIKCYCKPICGNYVAAAHDAVLYLGGKKSAPSVFVWGYNLIRINFNVIKFHSKEVLLLVFDLSIGRGGAERIVKKLCSKNLTSFWCRGVTRHDRVIFWNVYESFDASAMCFLPNDG